MNIRNIKLIHRVAIASILMLAMLLSCIGIIFSAGEKASAFKEGDYTPVEVNFTTEMLLDGYEEDTTGEGNVFNGKLFWQLISKITGNENPTMDTLNGLGKDEKTSADFHANNGGEDVVVIIDGIPWTATYLSQNEKKEPILTLWQADGIAIDYFNVRTNMMANNAAVWWHNGSENKMTTYPSNSYGTSAMSTLVLNNGGNYATTNTTTVLAEQHEESTYAKFTMDKVKGSLTSFIEVPNNMPYQKDNVKESAKTQSYNSQYKYYLNNDCL